MTIDELIAKIDGPKTEPETQTKVQETAQETKTETAQADGMLPIGAEFAEYCNSKKRK